MVESVNPETASLRPRIYHKGNLRLSIMCADTWATPDTGLVLTIDGAPLNAQRLNGQWSTYTTTDDDGNEDTGEVWNPTDIGYLVAPGRHHVTIDTPECTPVAFDMDAYPDHTQHAEGRLAVSDSSLMGPVGAPNGWGLGLGLWLGPTPSGPSTNSLFGQTATFDPGHTATGGALAFSLERRHLALAVDTVFGYGAISGQLSGKTLDTNQPASQAFTGSAYISTLQLRVGGRVPLHDIALEAGSGLGVQTWIKSTTLVGPAAFGLFAPDGIDASVYVPLWAAVTVKPGCDWGLQVLGQYDVHPTATDTNGYELTAGILFQPSASCSEPAGVHVAPR